MKKKELLDKIDCLSAEVKELNRKFTVMEWLRLHPTHAEYAVDNDFDYTPFGISQGLSITYFDKRTYELKTTKIVRSSAFSNIVNTMIMYDSDTGLLECTFTVANSSGTDEHYSYKRNLYQLSNVPQIYILTDEGVWRKVLTINQITAANSYIQL